MLIAEFHLSTPILRDALAAAPQVTVDLERTIDAEPARLEFFARGDDLTRFEGGLESDASVDDVRVLGEGPDFRFYRATLTDEAHERTTYRKWLDLDASPVSAVGDQNGWSYRFRFPSREALAEYRDACRELDITFTLHGLYERSDPHPGADEHGLANDREAV